MTASKKTILCVDDEPAIVDYLQQMFERAGYKADVSEGGWPAFEQIKAKAYDFVISDVRMVKGDGIEFLENVQDMPSPRPPVALLSAFTDVAASDIFDRGAVAFLQKPIVWETVLHTVERLTKPRPERWAETAAKGPMLQASWPSWNEAIKSGNLAFGSGGFFLAYKEVPAGIDQTVRFELQFGKAAPGKLCGSAVVRWTRSVTRHGFIPGVGLEILSLEQPSHAFVLAEIERSAPKPFVPIGYGRASS